MVRVATGASSRCKSRGPARDRILRMTAKVERPRRCWARSACPTLVRHRTGDLDSQAAEETAYLADRIPGARFRCRCPAGAVPRRVLPASGDAAPGSGGGASSTRRRRLTLARRPGAERPSCSHRHVVGSNREAGSRWATPAGAEPRRAASRARAPTARRSTAGVEVDTAGDGFFAAVRRSRSCHPLRTRHHRIPPRHRPQVRAGLHTGECELVGDKITGIAVNIGARLAAQARPGEVLDPQP